MNGKKQDIELFDSEEEIVPQKKVELFDLQGNTVNYDDAKNTLPHNADLIQKAMDGDKKAFSELYMQSYRYVFFIIRQYISDDETAYDVIQETFIKVYKNISKLRSPAAFYGWITSIAKNTAVDFLRTSRLENSNCYAEDYSDFLKDDSQQQDVTLDIETVLKKLEPKEAELLSLVYYDGMRISQIAKMQGVPVTTVYSRFNKAKRNLKSQLKVHGIDKAIYSGNFVSMITVSVRNMIGTSLLSVAIAQQILDSIVNGKGKKELAVAKIIRAQQKKAMLNIASIIVAISVATSAVTALTLIDWSYLKFFGDGNFLTNTVTEYYYQNSTGGNNISSGGFNSSGGAEYLDSSDESQSDVSSQRENSISSPVNFYEDEETDNTTTIVNTLGNNPNNVMRTIAVGIELGGAVAKQGDWLYYVQSATRLIKMKTDGSNKQVIYESSGFTAIGGLNVIGDTIYYINGGIWSMKTDGTNRKQISSKTAYNLLVCGTTGWFVDVNTASDTPAKYVHYSLYQIDLLTGEIITIVEDGSGFGLKTVIGNSLIYVNGNNVYRCDLSTGAENLIKQLNFERGIYNMCVNGSTIYFCGGSTDRRIIEIDVNNPSVIKATYNFGNVYNYFNYGGGTFYGSLDEKYTFYTLQGAMLCEQNQNIRKEVGIYTFDDGYAYYYDQDLSELYRCLPDGSDSKIY